MYDLRRLLVRHAEENTHKYILLIILFAVVTFCGLFFSQNISDSVDKELYEDVNLLIENFSKDGLEHVKILKTSFLKNVRIAALVFIGGLSIYLLPISFGAFLSYGFSVGFTMGYMILNFGVAGLKITLISIVFSLLINIPLYLCISVIALNNALGRKKERGKNISFGAYVVIFFLLFLVLVLSSLGDAFVVPLLISLICG